MCTACIDHKVWCFPDSCCSDMRHLLPGVHHVNKYTLKQKHTFTQSRWDSESWLTEGVKRNKKVIQDICLLTGRLLHIRFARRIAEQEMAICRIRSGSKTEKTSAGTTSSLDFSTSPPSIIVHQAKIRRSAGTERTLTICQERNCSRAFVLHSAGAQRRETEKHINLACGAQIPDTFSREARPVLWIIRVIVVSAAWTLSTFYSSCVLSILFGLSNYDKL